MVKLEREEYNKTGLSRDIEITERLDTVFDCLRSARRRYLLYYLYDTEDAVVSVEELVEAVQQYEEPDTASDSVPPRQSIRLSLVHVHLPRLEAVGAVDYDSCRADVRFHRYSSLEEWLERVSQLELA